MRASHMKANLASLLTLGDAAKHRIRAAEPEVVATIEQAIRTAWMPLELDRALTSAVGDEVGIEGVRAWSREAIVCSADGVLLGPILRGLQRIGLSPERAFLRAEYGWNLIYRQCGHLSFRSDDEENSGALVNTSAPQLMYDDAVYCEGIAGAWEAVIAVTGGRSGRVTVTREPNEERIRYDCRWDSY